MEKEPSGEDWRGESAEVQGGRAGHLSGQERRRGGRERQGRRTCLPGLLLSPLVEEGHHRHWAAGNDRGGPRAGGRGLAQHTLKSHISDGLLDCPSPPCPVPIGPQSP